MNFLQASCERLTNFFLTFYELLKNFLQTSYKLLKNFLKISYDLFCKSLRYLFCSWHPKQKYDHKIILKNSEHNPSAFRQRLILLIKICFNNYCKIIVRRFVNNKACFGKKSLKRNWMPQLKIFLVLFVRAQ